MTTDLEGRASGYFQLCNDGQGLLSGTIVSRPSWLRLNVHRFVGNHLQVYVQVDPSKLTIAGAVKDVVVIESNGGAASVAITCDVNVVRPIQNQTARPVLRDRPLVHVVEPEPDRAEEPPPPSGRSLLHFVRRSHQLLIGAVVAGALGALLLASSLGSGGQSHNTAEAAAISSLPPTLLTSR
jgi:hypothetical protein